MSNAFRELAKQRAQAEPERNPSGCWASNCPCRGSVSQEGGHFVCSAHACVSADRWPYVTEKLYEFSWLINFIDEIRRMDYVIDKNAPKWRDFAREFWTGIDDYCAPDPKEGLAPYQNRMRGELLYRCGLAKRPAPRLPKPIKGRGNAASFLPKETA